MQPAPYFYRTAQPTNGSHRGRVDTLVSQVCFSIDGEDDPHAVFIDVQHECLKWIAKRSRQARSQLTELRDGTAICDDHLTAALIDMPDGRKYWAISFKDRDKGSRNKWWVVELGLQLSGKSLQFRCRLSCTTKGAGYRIAPVLPRIVRGVAARQQTFMDGRYFDANPWLVDTPKQVRKLVDLLISKERRREVAVFALPEGTTDHKDAIVPVESVARAVVGVAHVVLLSSDGARDLSDAVGRDFAVYDDAVRFYVPGFNPADGNKLHHRLDLPEQIMRRGEKEYAQNVAFRLLTASIKRDDVFRQFPLVSETYRVASQIRDAAVTDRQQSPMLAKA